MNTKPKPRAHTEPAEAAKPIRSRGAKPEQAGQAEGGNKAKGKPEWARAGGGVAEAREKAGGGESDREERGRSARGFLKKTRSAPRQRELAGSGSRRKPEPGLRPDDFGS